MRQAYRRPHCVLHARDRRWRSVRIVSTANELSRITASRSACASPPLHFSGSKHSRKLFIAHDEQVQSERHAKFGEWARVELEKSTAKREGCVGQSPRFRLGIYLRT